MLTLVGQLQRQCFTLPAFMDPNGIKAEKNPESGYLEDNDDDLYRLTFHEVRTLFGEEEG